MRGYKIKNKKQKIKIESHTTSLGSIVAATNSIKLTSPSPSKSIASNNIDISFSPYIILFIKGKNICGLAYSIIYNNV
jgi:hypothetical protein